MSQGNSVSQYVQGVALVGGGYVAKWTTDGLAYLRGLLQGYKTTNFIDSTTLDSLVLDDAQPFTVTPNFISTTSTLTMLNNVIGQHVYITGTTVRITISQGGINKLDSSYPFTPGLYGLCFTTDGSYLLNVMSSISRSLYFNFSYDSSLPVTLKFTNSKSVSTPAELLKNWNDTVFNDPVFVNNVSSNGIPYTDTSVSSLPSDFVNKSYDDLVLSDKVVVVPSSLPPEEEEKPPQQIPFDFPSLPWFDSDNTNPPVGGDGLPVVGTVDDNSLDGGISVYFPNKANYEDSVLGNISYSVDYILAILTFPFKVVFKFLGTLVNSIKGIFISSGEIFVLMNQLFSFLPPPVSELIVLTFAVVLISFVFSVFKR